MQTAYCSVLFLAKLYTDKTMKDLQIITQLLNGFHLEPKELDVARELVDQLQTELKNR